MKIAMGTLAVLAVVGGVVGIPGVTDTLENFLEPTFEDSRYAHDAPEHAARSGSAWPAARSSRSPASRLAARIYLRPPGHAPSASATRFAGVHRFLVNKWYFDELYDAVFVRPMATRRQARPHRDRDATSCRA